MATSHAAVCRLGHVVSRDVAQEPAPRNCPRCGVTVIDRCLSCDVRLPGPEYELRRSPTPPLLIRVWADIEWKPDPMCHRCRRAHPWAHRSSSGKRTTADPPAPRVGRSQS